MATRRALETTTLRQGCMLPATPEEVYAAWMSSARHAAFTGGEAKISRKVGGAFTVFDGWATGRNVTLEPGRLIVQTWRAADWPEGHTSTIQVQLRRAANGTKLLFTHRGVPVGKARDIAKGWREFYWTPLRDHFAR